jgi:hypothetical protein
LRPPSHSLIFPALGSRAGKATAATNGIAAQELLFRLGIVRDLLCATMVMFLGLALRRWLKAVNQKRLF